MPGRVLPLALIALLTLLSACGDDDDEASTNTPIASPSPTQPMSPSAISFTSSPSPTVSVVSPSGSPPPEMPAFREFAAQVAAAVAARDGEFFASSGVEVEMVCRGDEQVGQCTSQPAGTLLRGIPAAAWASDAFGLVPISEFGSAIASWWASAIDDEDQFGPGTPQLYAIGATEDGLMSLQAILTNDPTTHEQERQTVAFVWKDMGKGWMLVREVSAFYRQGAQLWLSGTCSECYDYFELWPPATQ